MNRQLLGEWLDYDDTRFTIAQHDRSGVLQVDIDIADKGKPATALIAAADVPALLDSLRRRLPFTMADASATQLRLHPTGDDAFEFELIAAGGSPALSGALLFAIADQMALVLGGTELPAVRNG